MFNGAANTRSPPRIAAVPIELRTGPAGTRGEPIAAHAESIRLLEQVSEAAPVPAIYNNLGVEYAKTQNVGASRRAFELSKAKIAEVAAAAATNRPLSDAALKPPTVSGPAVRTESSAVPAMTIEALSTPYESPGEIHVIAHGTPLSGSYQVKYRPEPGDNRRHGTRGLRRTDESEQLRRGVPPRVECRRTRRYTHAHQSESPGRRHRG